LETPPDEHRTAADFWQRPRTTTLSRQSAAGMVADLRYPVFRSCGCPTPPGTRAQRRPL